MPERKNQHYVPQHYLRAWAANGQLNIFHLESGGIFSEGTDSVCARNYFYGNPPVVEEELANLEGYHARPLNGLRQGDNLPDFSDQYVQLLLSFVTTQRTRTKATKEDIRDGDDFIRDAVREDLEADRYEDRITWKSDLTEDEKEDALVDASLLGTHHYLISLGIFGYIGISDLEGIMLRNVTDREFIVSDVPVVHDIPQYSREQGIVPAGLANRGLQIFCPIDRNRILLLYDPEVYRFDANSRKQVLIKSPDVVDELNLLQFHNAESIVMFDSSSEDYIRGLHVRIDEVRRREEITVPLEVESGKKEVVNKVPAYQVPKLSPSLPGCTTMAHLPYAKQRPNCRSTEAQNLARRTFNETGTPDLGLITSIRVLEELLDLS
ncbi:uncharacterized protein DUF4238 [Natrinema hispanicum]|uniref:Uncharacterized protein DUF4238 n=1 Tax=Natrinema hispanicum TaxID=392421 RepID=A0A482Y162_9EURY|nr:DUF4238 domain-containing protein [Natrinema hispanicum]RZV05201.1 uncharacterized protein DUF4238 [Natrinema hispanicum]